MTYCSETIHHTQYYTWSSVSQIPHLLIKLKHVGMHCFTTPKALVIVKAIHKDHSNIPHDKF